MGLSKKSSLFYFGFFIVGLTIIIYGAFLIYKAKISEKWPKIKGEITKLEIIKKTKKKSVSYRPSIEYKYLVNNSNYVGNRISFWDLSSSDKSEIENSLRTFDTKKAVEVYYNPSSPSDSVLLPGTNWGVWQPFFGGFIVWLIALVVFFYEFLAKRFGWQK
ncbi:MAG: DUF3592 domain-containing protein [Candidatus Riflebacteria bacterium]|nr:DUF3592 domain-containing protein [Candidatus Riflebacteria bacterium]